MRETYQRIRRRLRFESIPANSGAAWRIICEECDHDPHKTPWGSDALRIQSHLQTVSYPQASLHHALAHRVLNFPALVRNHCRARRAANLAARMRHMGKVKVLDGNYIALPDDDSETLQNAWRALGRAHS